MKVEGDYRFHAPQTRVWEVFTSPEHLQKALPGCEKLVETEPGKYDAYLKIGIAAVKGNYQGTFQIVDAEPPHRFRLIGEGSGMPGFIKGETTIELTPEEQDTRVTYRGEVQVGGLIAGVGQRLIGGITKTMVSQFFKTIEKELTAQG